MADLLNDDPVADFLQQEEDQLRELGIDDDSQFQNNDDFLGGSGGNFQEKLLTKEEGADGHNSDTVLQLQGPVESFNSLLGDSVATTEQNNTTNAGSEFAQMEEGNNPSSYPQEQLSGTGEIANDVAATLNISRSEHDPPFNSAGDLFASDEGEGRNVINCPSNQADVQAVEEAVIDLDPSADHRASGSDDDDNMGSFSVTTLQEPFEGGGCQQCLDGEDDEDDDGNLSSYSAEHVTDDSDQDDEFSFTSFTGGQTGFTGGQTAADTLDVEEQGPAAVDDAHNFSDGIISVTDDVLFKEEGGIGEEKEPSYRFSENSDGGFIVTGDGDDGDIFGVGVVEPAEGEGEAAYCFSEDTAPENQEQEETPASTGQGAQVADVFKIDAESGALDRWREENEDNIRKMDGQEVQDKEDWLERARKEIGNWSSHYNEQIDKVRTENRLSEAQFVEEMTGTKPGNEWEKVATFCDFNQKNTKNPKDVSRMRSMLLQLKQTPLIR